MKAKDGVVDHLNHLLTIELTAINQYFIQAEICNNWGFGRLHKWFRDVSLEEMEDAQHLIQRVLFLETAPELQPLNQVTVGESAMEDSELDLQSGMHAVSALVDVIAHCEQMQGHTTRVMLPEVISSEEEHVDWLETQMETIGIIGMEFWLNQQIHKN